MKKFKYLLVIAAAGLLLVACGDLVPIQEMTTAKADISKAKSYNAEKYANEEYTAAIDLLKSCHSQLKENKKDDAKKSAIDASVKANEAIEKSLPLLTQDTIEIAETSLAQAEEAYASELATEEYTEANSQLETARSEFESKNYASAYAAALKSDELSKNARNTALSQKSTLQDAIDEVKETIARAKQYDAMSYAPDELQSAEENLSDAEKANSDLELKKGFESIGLAKADADKAYLIAVKEYALMTIEEAEDAIAKAEKSSGAKGAIDELNGSKELLSTSKSQFDETLYVESINSAEESKRLSFYVMKNGENQNGTNVADNNGTDNGDYILYKVKYREAHLKDCLWIIARKFYNDPFKWKVIYNANKDQIKDPDLIKPGWELKIPKPVVTEK
ncbi:MAG: DUF4398 domain-containing protein [Spirochaetes bacterium]|nr:DUF4398 domain-containing protein [Spirochaetota bacterium]